MKFCNSIGICPMQILVYFHVVLTSIVHFYSVQVSSIGNETDRLALLHFKESITGDPLGILNSWNSSIPHCSWFGVTCNVRHRRVAYLSLEGGKLSGPISPHIGNLSFLRRLDLQNNSFYGEIPRQVGKLVRMQEFALTSNELVGEIPGELGGLKNLIVFNIGGNNLSGVIPPFLFNFSSIEELSFEGNKFHGGLPDTGFNLPNLIRARFGGNNLSGKIPSSLTNASRLQLFDIGVNNFVGPVPSNIGDLSGLRWFNIGGNNLGRNSTNDLDFLASLSSCRNLETLVFHYNNLGGALADSLANLSDRLVRLEAGSNQIYGQIPSAFDNLTNLIFLSLSYNHLIGSIPSSIMKLQNLQALFLEGNRLSGIIPVSIGNLSQLSVLDLRFNNLEGPIPSSIGKCTHLYGFTVEDNNLTGQIPNEILNIPSLSLYVGLSGNRLSGSLPLTIGKLTTTTSLNVSYNLLSGEIPSTIDGCVSLDELFMQGNSFRGEIPKSMASMKGLRILDLSQNNLTGKIPQALQNLTYLQYLNISSNNLEGEVPTGGVFGNAKAVFLTGNSRLCGGISELHLPKCPTAGSKKGKTAKLKLPIIIGCLLLFVGLVAIVLVLYQKKRSKPKPPSSTFGVKPHITISYKSLHDATSGFSSQNLLGYGSFGSVYKGLIDQLERPAAVKVLNLQQQGVSKSIVAECNALRNVRHRNLVKLITYCSSLDYKGNDFKALVFEFMPNGSLENWLHPTSNQPGRLDILQRLDIVIDVAFALHYLHDLSEVPIIHRDLKPSNVLLDDDMVAHVGDFGLAKFLSTSESLVQGQTSTLGIQGTTGYVAPEYGLGAGASKEGDIYSYGILLLEMFSGRRPTDDNFTDGLNLVDFIKEALPERVMQVADPVLLIRDADETEVTSSSAPLTRDEEEGDHEIEQAGHRATINKKMKPHELRCLLAVFEIGVSCSDESPNQRANLDDVLRKLHRAKENFLSVQLNKARRQANYARQSRRYEQH